MLIVPDKFDYKKRCFVRQVTAFLSGIDRNDFPTVFYSTYVLQNCLDEIRRISSFNAGFDNTIDEAF